eukprot:GCRY01002495.1.p1 GENE.GCRY01002495.1~~GCRY01002495.1.p1  ORF type:complete len:510 (-),score=92.87 GCRY01002495.1:1413-2942(-)
MERRKDFRSGVSMDDSRRKREDQNIQIRKEKKNQQMKQRRRLDDEVPEAASSAPQLQDLAKIPQYTQELFSDNIETVYNAVAAFRKLLSNAHNPPIQQVIDNGCVPRFVELLQSSNEKLQFEAAWALTNIASGDSMQTRVVVNAGAVPHFITLLTSSCPEVREQAVWALGNIAGDSPECRQYVLSCGILTPLLENLVGDYKNSNSMRRNLTWTLSNLCRGRPSEPEFNMLRAALPVLARLIFEKDNEVLADACWALSYLSDGDDDSRLNPIIAQNIVPRLVALLMHPKAAVQTPALRTIGNICTGIDRQTQTVINAAALPPLLALVASPKSTVQKEAVWTISNITAGSPEQIQAVISANILPTLIQLLNKGEYDVKKEACWAIVNAITGGTEEHVRVIIESGCISPLCECLTLKDFKLVSAILDSIEKILSIGKQNEAVVGQNIYLDYIENAEGLTYIENLQLCDNKVLINKARRILKDYCDTEEETVEVSNKASYEFSAGSSNVELQF